MITNLSRPEELTIKDDIGRIRKAIENLSNYFGPPAPPDTKSADTESPIPDPFFGKIHMSQAHMDEWVKDFNAIYIGLVSLMEECSELQQASSKYYRKFREVGFYEKCAVEREAMIEEMAHVLIDIRMICHALYISSDAIQQEIYKKYPEGYKG